MELPQEPRSPADLAPGEVSLLSRYYATTTDCAPVRLTDLIAAGWDLQPDQLATGSTAEGIAARLLISPRTVHKHQENLYRKLRAYDRLSAVLAAQRFGMVPVGGAADSPERSS
jgi:hypothetical protein